MLRRKTGCRTACDITLVSEADLHAGKRVERLMFLLPASSGVMATEAALERLLASGQSLATSAVSSARR